MDEVTGSHGSARANGLTTVAVGRVSTPFGGAAAATEPSSPSRPRLVHPVLGIDYPLQPRRLWRHRRIERPRLDCAPEEFLRQVWGDVTAHHGLASFMLVRLDRALYAELLRSAVRRADDADRYFLGLGILSKRTMLSPPPQVIDAALFLHRVAMWGGLADRHSQVASGRALAPACQTL